jgi:hypothetical protein
MLQMAAVLVLGLLMSAGPTRIVEIEREVVTVENLEDREKYRQLRDAHLDLERKSRRSNLLADLEESRNGGEAFFERLAGAIQRATGIGSVGIYSLAQFDDVMVVRGVAGNYGEQIQDASIAITLRQARDSITEKALKALTAMKPAMDGRTVSNVLLTDKGRIVGMIALVAQDPFTANQGRERIEEVSGTLCQWIVEFQRRESWRRRAQQAETLYELAIIQSGATTPEALADRVVSDLWEIIDADHIALWRIHDDHAVHMAQRGVATVAYSGGCKPGLLNSRCSMYVPMAGAKAARRSNSASGPFSVRR